jgi:hypothetical protein
MTRLQTAVENPALQQERKILALTLADAQMQAAGQRPHSGLILLLDGRQACESRAAGSPWASRLISLWRTTIVSFETRHFSR